MHAGIVLEKQVNKEVDEGYKHLKRQSKESKKQRILEEIKKASGQGSGAAPESPYHIDSDNSCDKSDKEDEINDADSESKKDSDNDEDKAADFVIRPHDKELVQIPKEPQLHSPSVTITSTEDAIEKKNNWKKAVKQRLDDHEQRLNALSQVNNAKAIKKYVQATVVKKFKTQVSNLLPKSTSTPVVDPTEYELKHQLYEKIFTTAAYLKHDKHRALYYVVQESMQVDELQARFGQKGAGGSLSKRGKAQDYSPYYERGDDAEELRHEERHEHELVDAEDEPEEHKLLNGLVVLFGKCMKNFLNKDKITKEDLKVLAFELLKKRFKNRPLGIKTILVSYFFNRDLEYLKYGNEEKKYALSVTKIMAVRYEDEGIKEMISYLWSPSIQKYNRDVKFVESVKVFKKYVYAYLEETVIKRTYEKEYMFAEADFLNLNQNDIKDLYLLKIQNKIGNIKGVEEFDLINSL
ncbi:hypothetical protein Tco_0746419 [Tanacetum coccineum]